MCFFISENWKWKKSYFRYTTIRICLLFFLFRFSPSFRPLWRSSHNAKYQAYKVAKLSKATNNSLLISNQRLFKVISVLLQSTKNKVSSLLYGDILATFPTFVIRKCLSYLIQQAVYWAAAEQGEMQARINLVWHKMWWVSNSFYFLLALIPSIAANEDFYAACAFPTNFVQLHI